MKRIFSYIVLMLTAAACVYPYTPDIDEAELQGLVVDANILLGNTSTVNLSTLQNLEVGQRGGSSGYVRPSGSVFLESDQGEVYEAEGSSGQYKIAAFDAPEGRQYRLKVVCEGKTYYSEWVEPEEAPEISGINFSADDNMVYVLLSMKDGGSGSGYAAAQIEEIWRFHAECIKYFDYEPATNSIISLILPDDENYWCWRKEAPQNQTLIKYIEMGNKVENFQLSSFMRSNNRNHREYRVKVKLWNLTPQQYLFRKMLEENASIGGNLFSPEPGEVRGNLYCEDAPDEKVYGYVNISKVTTGTAQLGEEYWKEGRPYPLVVITPEEYFSYYQNGYAPVFMVDTETGPAIGWGQARCYDCVAAGGVKEEPEFD